MENVTERDKQKELNVRFTEVGGGVAVMTIEDDEGRMDFVLTPSPIVFGTRRKTDGNGKKRTIGIVSSCGHPKSEREDM